MAKLIPREEDEIVQMDEEAERWLDRFPIMNSYATVVVLIILDLFTFGFTSQNEGLKLPLLLLNGLVLLTALHVSRVRPRTFVIAVTSVVVLFIAGALGTTFGGPGWRTVVALAGGMLLVIPPVAILRHVRVLTSERGVTLEAVYAAVAVYILIGSFYAYLYSMVAYFSHSPFFVQTDHATAVIYVYFSFVTQATVGYGDYTAASSLGRMLAVSQALIGQLYLVTVVALLVSNLGPAQRASLRRKSAAADAPEGAPSDAGESAGNVTDES